MIEIITHVHCLAHYLVRGKSWIEVAYPHFYDYSVETETQRDKHHTVGKL